MAGRPKVDIKEFDLESSLKEVQMMRKLYPLDDKLKMISIELNHKRVNKLIKE